MAGIFVHDLTVFQGSAPLCHSAYYLNFSAGHCSFWASISALGSLAEGPVPDSGVTEAHRTHFRDQPPFATVFISAVAFDRLMIRDTYLKIEI